MRQNNEVVYLLTSLPPVYQYNTDRPEGGMFASHTVNKIKNIYAVKIIY